MILHTVNSSPFSTFSLHDCLKQLSENDLLLLTGDAVIAASACLTDAPALRRLHDNKRLFVLQADLKARGLNVNVGHVVDYAGFVNLCIDCKSQLAW